MEHSTVFRLIYTLILGIVIALFVGVGVQAFYEPPKHPEFANVETSYKAETPSPEQQEAQRKYDNDLKAYNEQQQKYEKNVSAILVLLAVVVIAIGITFTKQFGFLSDGILLGGLFTLVHSLIRGLGAEDSKFLFLIASVAVATILFLGYKKFIPKHSARK